MSNQYVQYFIKRFWMLVAFDSTEDSKQEKNNERTQHKYCFVVVSMLHFLSRVLIYKVFEKVVFFPLNLILKEIN